MSRLDIGTTVLVSQAEIEAAGFRLVTAREHVRAGPRFYRFECVAIPVVNHAQRPITADLDAVDFSAHCPHGRPVMVRQSLADIDKMFKRS